LIVLPSLLFPGLRKRLPPLIPRKNSLNRRKDKQEEERNTSDAKKTSPKEHFKTRGKEVRQPTDF
jgi:hypothetical protein